MSSPLTARHGMSPSDWRTEKQLLVGNLERIRVSRPYLNSSILVLSIRSLISDVVPADRTRGARQTFNQMLTNPCRHIIERLPWQFYYWSGIIILFAWAAWKRFVLALDPSADPDTWGYLSPALRELTDGEFGHTYGRNFIYPGFVYLLLRVFGDFRAITVTQHLLGLIAGGMLLLTWRRIRDFIPSAHLPRPIHRYLGLLAAAIYMFSREPLCFEMDIRPEGICGFL